MLWTLGLYSLMGFSYNVLASMLVPLVVVLAIADDVHIMQHWDEERRHGDNEHAFKATVAHLAAPLLGASATTALGMLSLATSNVVAVAVVRHRIGGRHHGRLRDLARPGADAAHAGEAGDGGGAAREVFHRAAAGDRAASRARIPAACWRSRSRSAIVAALGILRLRVDTNHINFFSARHPLGQSAAVIDKELGRRLQLPDHARRAARLAEDARRAAAHRSPAGSAAAVPARPQGHVGRRLRQADQQGAERRPARGERHARRRATRSRRSCSSSRSAAKAATSSSASSRATTRARRSTSSCSR